MTSSIDVGGVVSKVFDLYRQYAGVLLPVAAVIFLVEGVLTLLFDDSLVLSFVVAIIGIVLAYLYTGMVVHLVDDVRDGRLDQSVGQLFSRVMPVLGTLILAAILAGIGIGIGFVLLIVPGLVLLTFWSVIAPVILLEKADVIKAFKRSTALVKDHFFAVLGVIVLFFLIGFGVSILLGAIGVAAGDEVRALLAYVGRVITAPLAALASAVLYFELKAAHGEVAPPPESAPPADVSGLGGTV